MHPLKGEFLSADEPRKKSFGEKLEWGSIRSVLASNRISEDGELEFSDTLDLDWAGRNCAAVLSELF